MPCAGGKVEGRMSPDLCMFRCRLRLRRPEKKMDFNFLKTSAILYVWKLGWIDNCWSLLPKQLNGTA